MRHGDRVKSLIGDDLWSLACSIGDGPSEATILTPLPSETSVRASFRLDYRDGAVVKGRRMQSAEAARRVTDLLGLLDPKHRPALRAIQGDAYIVDWVDGMVPDARDIEVCERAGALLGKIHGTRVPAGVAARYGFPPERWAQRLERNLTVLTKESALATEVLSRARTLVSDTTPSSVPQGLVHCDFCPENLILDGDHALQMIDNENLTFDAVPFDLARTSYRWPLDGHSAEPFWAGYRTLADPGPFLNHRVYWMIQALSEAAAFRVAGRTPHARVPLDALERLVKNADQSGETRE